MAKQMHQYADNTFPTDPAQLAVHGASIGSLIATAMGYLPVVVALIPAIYYCILIFESKTVQRFFKRRRLKRLAARIHRKRSHS